MNKKNKLRCIFYPLFIGSVVGSVLWMKHMPGSSYSGAPVALTASQQSLTQQYKNQLNMFATKPRNYMYIENLRATENFLINTLKEQGHSVNIQEYGANKYKNIEVVLEPKNESNTQTIVIGAHYDTHEASPGADDNGSAVVILLELANRFKQHYDSSNTRLRIVFFANEEPPFFKSEDMGSTRYATMLYNNKENVKGMYAFDMLGRFTQEPDSQHYPFLFAPFFPSTGNFVAFIGTTDSRKIIQESIGAFRENAAFPSEGVSAPRYIQGIDFSDHLSFYHYGWPALMISDTAFYRNLDYHTEKDTIDRLNIDKMAQLTDDLEKMFRKLYDK